VKSERIVSSTVMRRWRSVDSKESRGGQSPKARKRRRQQVKSSRIKRLLPDPNNTRVFPLFPVSIHRNYYDHYHLPPSSRVRDRHRSTSIVIATISTDTEKPVPVPPPSSQHPINHPKTKRDQPNTRLDIVRPSRWCSC
jgi:hypothetical protein